jgi:hypothetical protein
MVIALIGVVSLGALAFTWPDVEGNRSAPVQTEKRGALEVVATGLNNPRKVTWDAEQKRLLVAEAGTSCGSGTNCFNKTGSILAYKPGEHRGKRIVNALPTLTLFLNGRIEVIGVHEVNTQNIRGWGDDLVAAIGLGYTATAEDRTGYGPDAFPLGQITRVTKSGRIIPLADMVTYEGKHNPDGVLVECNPYGMIHDGSGFVVADAAANAVLRVKPNGDISVRDVPPRLEHKPESVDSAPTSIVRDREGAYFVGELTGVPFPVGGARVWKLSPGKSGELVSDGFTNILDLAIDRKGRLLVLEMAQNGLLSRDTTGRLVRIEPNGEHTVLASEGLESPGGIEVTPNGDLYITNHTNGPNGGGELLRMRGMG